MHDFISILSLMSESHISSDSSAVNGYWDSNEKYNVKTLRGLKG